VNAIDIVFSAFVVAAGLIGYSRGLLRSLVGIAGFAAGALVGSLLTSHLMPSTIINSHTTATLMGFLVGGFIGFALTGLFSGVMRRVLLPFKPLRIIDRVLGVALLSALALGLVWVIADLASTIGGPTLSQTMSNSRVITVLNRYAPQSAIQWGQQVSDNLARNPIPQVFRTLVTGIPPAVPTPTATAIPKGANAALGSVVRIEGTAPSCKADITGSGFVVGPGRVLTNAHVIAGVENPRVRVGGHGPDYSAVVVGINRSLDVAVLDVVGLDTRALAFGAAANEGAEAAIAGFPGGRGLVASPAVVGPTTSLNGIDIDGATSTSRRVIVFSGRVEHGDSGGPLLDANGRVIGMVFASDPTKTDVGFALRPVDIVPLVLQTATSIAPVDTGACAAGVSGK
jgi:S1-C subfamily serine protease